MPAAGAAARGHRLGERPPANTRAARSASRGAHQAAEGPARARSDREASASPGAVSIGCWRHSSGQHARFLNAMAFAKDGAPPSPRTTLPVRIDYTYDATALRTYDAHALRIPL